jgi:hypothetical protein
VAAVHADIIVVGGFGGGDESVRTWMKIIEGLEK